LKRKKGAVPSGMEKKVFQGVGSANQAMGRKKGKTTKEPFEGGGSLRKNLERIKKNGNIFDG